LTFTSAAITASDINEHLQNAIVSFIQQLHSNRKRSLAMIQQRYFVVFTIFLYFSLFVLFQRHHFTAEGEISCYSDGCVRFCCKNEKLCTQEFIANHFNLSSSGLKASEDDSEEDDEDASEDRDFVAVFGKPKCNLKSAGFDWKIKNVSDRLSTSLTTHCLFPVWISQSWGGFV
jgi:hypothetical protein